VPYVDYVKFFDIRKQQGEFEGEAATKDQQSVHTKITVWFSPDQNQVNKIYQEVGIDYADKLLAANVSESMKSEVAKYNALGLLSERARISSRIRDNLKERLAPYGVLVDSVAIGNFEFSKEFNRAIEEKQTAEQNALKKQYELLAAQKEAEIEIAKANGQAKSAQIVASAIAGNPNYMALKKMENMESIARLLAQGKNIVYLPSNAIFTLPTTETGK
jgi:regulator of protease activity HflC (stomatin/prohibitin superfamily)